MDFFARARERGLNAPNIISWLCLEAPRIWGAFYGTLRFRAKARLLGVKVGAGTRVHGGVGLLRWPGGVIEIGSNVSIISSWRRSTACSLAFPARLRVFGPGAAIIIGDGAELSGTSITARSTRITIGKKALIGPNCILTDSDFHSPWPAEERSRNPGYEADAPVSIGDYAWLGMNCIVLKGRNIGRGAIVGAGSVVASDIPAGCVACGNPARIIRERDGNASK